jgi:uncharacterized protein YbjT (DUF2867 family)
MTKQTSLILLTGATGYVGGRLLKALESRGCRVRCLARHPDSLRGKVARGTDIVLGDVTNPVGLSRSLAGVHTAYYLVHALGVARDFEQIERRSAENFGRACELAGVKKIIYLGGLGDSTQSLSAHLRSRHLVGDILRRTGIPVIEFRSSMIIGSGSLSFEMVRALVERLPVMITPKWVHTLTQPISIEDVIEYLAAGLDQPAESKIFEIGGPDRTTYAEIMREYARLRGLRRWMIPVPLLSPRLSSLWLGLVTPVYARVGRKLVDSLTCDMVVQNDSALQVFSIKPRGFRDSIERALNYEDTQWAQTRWSDAVSSSGLPRTWGGVRFGTRVVDTRSVRVEASPAAVFSVVQQLGGDQGWYTGHWLWKLRGYLDLLVGGVGLRRGRRHPVELAVGDALDFWRVEAFDPGRRLRLVAEMKVPGRAWLEFEVVPEDTGSVLKQTALFDPMGLFGLLYWYGLYPLHQYVFGGLLGGIVERSMKGTLDEY